MSRIRSVTKIRLLNVLSNVTYSLSYQKKSVKLSAQLYVLAKLPKEEYNVPSNVMYSPIYQNKTVKRSVQCHVSAQLTNEECKAFYPMSRIPPVAKRRV